MHVASLRSTRAVWPFRPRQHHPLAEFELARKRSAVECFSECATELYPRVGLPKDLDLSRGHLRALLKALGVMALAGVGLLLIEGGFGYRGPFTVGLGVALLAGAAILLIVWSLRRPSA